MKKALIVVDIQNDFTPGGALAVAEGHLTAIQANELAKSGNYDKIVATQDWHPVNHRSFASNNPGVKVFELGELNGIAQVFWPDHCVGGSKGAEMHPDLDISFDKVFQKGTNPDVDSYSGFRDNDKKSETGLEQYLKGNGITHVDIVGLATDYCVKSTALDAIELGFITTIIHTACKAVNMNAGDEDAALITVLRAGGALK